MQWSYDHASGALNPVYLDQHYHYTCHNPVIAKNSEGRLVLTNRKHFDKTVFKKPFDLQDRKWELECYYTLGKINKEEWDELVEDAELKLGKDVEGVSRHSRLSAFLLTIVSRRSHS